MYSPDVIARLMALVHERLDEMGKVTLSKVRPTTVYWNQDTTNCMFVYCVEVKAIEVMPAFRKVIVDILDDDGDIAFTMADATRQEVEEKYSNYYKIYEAH